jgi:hypothetical protein
MNELYVVSTSLYVFHSLVDFRFGIWHLVAVTLPNKVDPNAFRQPPTNDEQQQHL